MSDLLDMMEELEGNSAKPNKDHFLRAPFGYPGGKTKSVRYIIEHLPQRGIYVEPFGGSAAVMLARNPSKLEVFNDRYAGVVAFYRVMRDEKKTRAFIDWMDLNVHSREEWVLCRDTWETVDDDVERAARWYYMTVYSFSQIGRNFGRATSVRGRMAGKIRNKLELFAKIHERFQYVQVENLDWQECVYDYDDKDAVFYMDPPYIDASAGAHKHTMSQDDHRQLLDTIFHIKGFVALSGYSNPLYEDREWDKRFSWDSFVSLQSLAYTEGNKKDHLEGHEERKHAEEVLWIKEARP